LWVVNCLMRYEIAIRGVREDFDSIGPFWQRTLLKRRWFRAALAVGPARVIKTGVDRTGGVVVGPPPVDELLPEVTEACGWEEKLRVKFWTGRKVRAVREELDRREWKSRRWHRTTVRARWELGPREWLFVWPKAVWELYSQIEGALMKVDRGKWRIDHPLRVPRARLREVLPLSFSPPPCLLEGVPVLGGGWRDLPR